MVGRLAVSQQNVEKSYGTLFLTLRLHLSRVNSLSLIENTVLHVESEERLDTTGCKFTLEDLFEPNLMALFENQAKMTNIESK